MCAGATSAQAQFNPATLPLDDAALSELRGGFLLGDLEIAIGLEQIVAINGEIQVINQLNIPNLNLTSPMVELISTNQMVHNEMDGSSVLVNNQLLPGAGIFTQIQNSLDQQVIQNMRTLNIELNNVGGFNGFIPSLTDSHLLQSPGR
jgi:hypothetical protein